MAIRGIFFDAAGVLYHRPQSTSRYVMDLLKRRGIAPKLDDARRARLKALRAAANSGRMAPDEYWDAVLIAYGVGAP
ncbi:MAG: hypothetical protein H5T65_14065, partial [Chloroflexi bacterium]|nr:hypothetical protein [Chloroflexota bacterium]